VFFPPNLKTWLQTWLKPGYGPGSANIVLQLEYFVLKFIRPRDIA